MSFGESKLSADRLNYTLHWYLTQTLRYLIVYKYGGFYFDLDTITLKSFESLKSVNGFAYNINEPALVISSGYFNLPKQHPFLEYIVKTIGKFYQARRYVITFCL